MNIRIIVLVAGAATQMWSIQDSHATPSVDVLVALAPEVYDQNPATIAAEFEQRMTVVMANSAMLQEHFRFRPYILSAAYGLGGSGTGSLAVAEVEQDTFLQVARDNAQHTAHLGVDSYDLIILVVPELRNDNGAGICGYATTLAGVNPLEPDAADNKYIAILSFACSDDFQITLAHEIGHLFAGNHEVKQGATCAPSEDCFPLVPVEYNHPVFHYDVGGQLVATSVMASSASFPVKPQYSSITGTLVDTSGLPAGNASANMRHLIQFLWTDVAAYRPLSSPVPACTITFTSTCYSYSTYPSYHFMAELPGYSVNSVLFQRQIFFGWQDIYEGPSSSCVISETFGQAMTIRSLLDTVQGISECTISIPAPALCE